MIHPFYTFHGLYSRLVFWVDLNSRTFRFCRNDIWYVRRDRRRPRHITHHRYSKHGELTWMHSAEIWSAWTDFLVGWEGACSLWGQAGKTLLFNSGAGWWMLLGEHWVVKHSPWWGKDAEKAAQPRVMSVGSEKLACVADGIRALHYPSFSLLPNTRLFWLQTNAKKAVLKRNKWYFINNISLIPYSGKMPKLDNLFYITIHSTATFRRKHSLNKKIIFC